jgi:tRNA modification GTPase
MVRSFQHLDDTIAAVSTPGGQGGIGIVRISGPVALPVADQIFIGRNQVLPSQYKSFTVHVGHVVKREAGEPQNYTIIDEVLLTVMRAPHSYTTEDIVEISSHGGPVSVHAILKLVLSLDARLAEPGEFTKRAFLNGRIDLVQAEAVLDIIQSKTDAYLKVSSNQLKGELSTELERIRGGLMAIYTEIEAMVNFPEDDVEPAHREALRRKISEQEKGVDHLLASSEHGKILREGIKIVIAGRPNVGKSSLLNALLKQPRAIVSEIAGTTRDTIEENAQIHGIPYQLIDTAGILEPRDVIEQEAVKRSHMYIQGADLVLFLFDVSQPVTEEDRMLAEQFRHQNLIVILNKNDLDHVIDTDKVKQLFPGKTTLAMSTFQKEAIRVLEKEIFEHIWHGKTMDPRSVMVSNLRHIERLRRCRASLENALTLLARGVSVEFVSEELKEAVHQLDYITGRDLDEDLLDTIFSRFCIGK